MDTLESLLHDLDYHIGEDGNKKGALKAWITRKYGKNTATRKKHGKYSKSLHKFAKDFANTLQLDKTFTDKGIFNGKKVFDPKTDPNGWIANSYRIAYTIAKKRYA